MTVFEHLLNQVHSTDRGTQAVSLKQYQNWKKLFSFDALRNQRFGQSFCNHFNITDNRLFYDRDWQRCENLIMREWIDRS